MKPAPFEYYAPTTVEEALAHLAEFGSEAKVLAGGQSLVPTMNFRLAQPAVLIDLNRVAELFYLTPDRTGGLRIGAMTRQRQLERDPEVARRAPLVHETMPYVAHVQIRNRGTVGGSMAHADPAAELPAVAVALGSRFRLRRQGGERWVPADQFFVGLFATALEPNELLVEVALPAWPPASGWAFTEMARRHGDYALVGVAAVVTLVAGPGGYRCGRARLVFLSVGDGPVEAHKAAALLAGQPLTPETIQAAADTAATVDIDPGSDIHATAAFRRYLARSLARRALATATDRAMKAAKS